MYKAILQKYEPVNSNLMFILHDIQDNHPQNYIPEDATREISEYMGIPESHIYGVITFYSMFSTKPRGKHIIRLCESPPCWLRGSEAILDTLESLLDVRAGGTTKDGMFTLELCACLGVCGNAPVVMIDEDVFGDLTPAGITGIINSLREEK
ncbi:MAG: NADH-quinone oxidoreductase subunit NuoE [Candidatus Cloacimonetes bacterium]|nr:NADH-quinone oxidoreductase subunit NuoE [Candidatus Cloacimonadota bacterium]